MKSLNIASLLLVFLFLTEATQAQQLHEFNLNETYSISDGGTVHLSSDDAEVTITGSDRNDVHVVVYRKIEVQGLQAGSIENFEVKIENRNGDLHIFEDNSGDQNMVVGSVREEYTINIDTPRNTPLDIEGDDDHYAISDLDGDISLDADDTEVELQRTSGQHFSFSIDDGLIQMDEGQGILNLNMDDGEFSARQGNFTEINADTDDGTIKITTSLAEEGSYRFDTDDGDIELNVAGGGGIFEINYDDASITTGSPYEMQRDEEGFSIYKLTGGNAQVEIKIDDGNINLRVI